MSRHPVSSRHRTKNPETRQMFQIEARNLFFSARGTFRSVKTSFRSHGTFGAAGCRCCANRSAGEKMHEWGGKISNYRRCDASDSWGRIRYHRGGDETSHGRPVRLRQSPSPSSFAMCGCARSPTRSILTAVLARGRLFGRHAIRRQDFWSTRFRMAQRRRRMDGLHSARLVDRRR